MRERKKTKYILYKLKHTVKYSIILASAKKKDCAEAQPYKSKDSLADRKTTFGQQ